MIGHYLRGIQHGDGLSKRELRSRATTAMMRKVGVATMVTAATTTIGFGSSVISPLKILTDFGIATALGMSFNLVATVLVVPMLLTLIGPTKTRLAGEDQTPHGIFGKVSDLANYLAENHSKKIIISVLVIGIVGLSLGVNLHPNNDPMSFLKPENAIVHDAETMHQNVSGVQIFYVTFDGNQAGYFLEPENLQIVEKVGQYIRQSPDFDQVISLADHVSYVNREWRTGDPADYRVPDDRKLIEQYMLFFQRGDIENFATSNYDSVALMVRHNLFDSQEIEQSLTRLNNEIEKISGGKIPHNIVSQSVLVNRAAVSLVESQFESFGIVVLVIFTLISLMYSSFRLGLVSLVPNILPALVVFGFMAAFDFPLNPGTILVAVVALGIAVDDTIHLMTNYSQVSKTIRDPNEAVRKVVSSQVVAVVTTSVSLCASFLIFTMSDFAVVSDFGILCALALVVAVIADLLVTPIFLRFVRLVSIWDVLTLDMGVDALMQSPLFAGMSKFQVKKALLLCEVKELTEDTCIVSQGQDDHSMYMVLEGTAGVWRKDEKGMEHFISTLSTGDIFGEVGFIGATKRTADVRAMSDVKLLRLSADDVAYSLKLYPHIAAKLYKNISNILGQRLSSTLETINR